MSKTESANRNYQDSLFSKLFSTPEKLIELYNALEGTDYGPDTKVEITTLENVFYLGRKNDLGFTIAGRYIVLAEAQSTPNPNMPLRQLLYFGRTLEHLAQSLRIYSTRLQKLPTPEFYVMYSGEEEWNVKTLRLSESFSAPAPENSAELVVKVINLRYNKDNEILQRSETLEGYSRIVHYVKSGMAEGLDLTTSIDRSIARCIEEGCMADYLRKHSREVGNMLYEEVTWEEVMELRAKEAAEDAFLDGMEKGMAQGHQAGLAEGREEGMAQGMEKGMEKGRVEGILTLMEAYRELGFSEEEILTKAAEKYHLSEEEIRNMMENNPEN